MRTEKRVFVAGICNVETTLDVSGFPVPYYPVDFPFYGVNSTVSGVGFNVAAALKSLSTEVHLATLIGPDRQGRWVCDELKQRQLSDDGVLRELDATCQSVILADPTGRRQAHTDLKDIQDRSYPLELATAALADADLAVLCNVQFARPLLHAAQSANVPIVTDVHVLSQIEDDYNRDFLSAADIIFLSDESLGGQDAEDYVRRLARRYEPKLVVMGCGSSGALLYERASDSFLRQKALMCRPVVNTIGAGDALLSGFVQAYLAGKPLRECLLRAVIFAGWKTGEAGGAQGFLTLEELETLMPTTAA